MEGIVEKFWSRVDVGGSGCWEWTAGRNIDGGYGRLRLDGGLIMAHRLAWILTYGPIPEGLSVCHHCDNPPCCNPSHLFVGTQADNVMDAMKKGRQRMPMLSGADHGQAKLTWPKVQEIRKLYKMHHISQYVIGNLYGVSQGQIWHIITGKHWRT
jgi:hypothetical protein